MTSVDGGHTRPGEATAREPQGRDSSTADRVASRLRDLIVTGYLSPGEHIRQERMAVDLGVSRAPLREALKQLASEGLVSHLHNSGYAVARLNRTQFDQIYLMRHLLESEVIRRLGPADQSVIAELWRLNDEMTDAAERGDLIRMQRDNYRFHFTIFEQSELGLVVSELERLWSWAMPYHVVYLYDSAGRQRLIAEHTQMVKALEAGDNEALVQLMNDHRMGGERHLGAHFDHAPLVSLHEG